jgi:predicted MPP superfamily phosphohydrolase
MAPSWTDLLPEIRAHKEAADRAVKDFESTLSALNEAFSSGDKARIEAAFSKSVQAWTALFNSTDRLAGLGLASYEEHPEKVKYLVSGTVLELTSNLLDAASALNDVAGSMNVQSPLAWVREQPRGFEWAQQLIVHTLPESVETYKTKFEKLMLPTPGFSAANAPAVRPGTQSTTRNAQPDSNRDIIRILHISDLHRTNDEKVSNDEVFRFLKRALTELKDVPLDLVVLSGDVAQSATEQEYVEAEAFLSNIASDFLAGKKNRCIIVPGNHDVDWTKSSDNFKITKGKPGTSDKVPGAVEIKGGWLVPTKGTLTGATDNFRASYKRFFGVRYPEHDDERCLYVEPDGLDIGLVLLDTTIGMHPLNDTPTVDRQALDKALDKALENGGRKFIIAIGHHGPVVRPMQSDSIESWVLERLLRAGVKLYLHGHVHETQLFYYSTNGLLQLPCIGVGSLVAGPAQRPESAPRQYQIVELPILGKRGVVKVRQKDRRDTAWRRDMRFGTAQDPNDTVEFSLT